MAEEKRPGRKRLTVDIPTIIFNAVAKEVIESNSTLTKYVLRALIEQLRKDEQFK